MKKKIGIINLNINNIHSIYEACVKANFKVKVIDKNVKKFDYDVIILPGIGSFEKAMLALNKMKFQEKIEKFLLNRDNLLLGICLGMQLLFSKSYEFGVTAGLNLIPGEVIRLDSKIIVPHTGWANITLIKKNDQIIRKNLCKKMFYFTHSYYCKPKFSENILCETKYKNFSFCSAVKKNNIYGVQFHPEKSSLSGINLLKNLNDQVF